jgi:hypothetical protein
MSQLFYPRENSFLFCINKEDSLMLEKVQSLARAENQTPALARAENQTPVPWLSSLYPVAVLTELALRKQSVFWISLSAVDGMGLCAENSVCFVLLLELTICSLEGSSPTAKL